MNKFVHVQQRMQLRLTDCCRHIQPTDVDANVTPIMAVLMLIVRSISIPSAKKCLETETVMYMLAAIDLLVAWTDVTFAASTAYDIHSEEAGTCILRDAVTATSAATCTSLDAFTATSVTRTSPDEVATADSPEVA